MKLQSTVLQLSKQHWLPQQWIIIFLSVTFISCGVNNQNLIYIDKDKPEIEKKIFAPGFISKTDESEFGSVFSKNGTEFYYAVDAQGKSEIRYTGIEGEKWVLPKTIILDKIYSYNDPFLSPDEKKLYYISDQPRNDSDTINDIDIWYSEKENQNKWSAPINAGELINSDKEEYYISFTSKGIMYFSSNKESAPNRNRDFEIYNSELIDGKYQPPIKLGESINSNRYEADVFISPDESYIIFCAIRKSGYGSGDLFIPKRNCFRTFLPDLLAATIVKNTREYLHLLRFLP